jgi:hypothetical protein
MSNARGPDGQQLCVLKLGGVRVHYLRHSYASILASAGLSPP